MERLPVEPTITDVMKASKFLRNRVRRTPAEYSFALSERAGAPVVLKLDNQQICGSFKVRGAFYKMFSLSRETLERGVVTCSSGNHAQGVAKAAAELRAKAWIYVPDVCPETNIHAFERSSAAAFATPCAWLPLEQVTTPRASSSRGSENIL